MASERELFEEFSVALREFISRIEGIDRRTPKDIPHRSPPAPWWEAMSDLLAEADDCRRSIAHIKKPES